MAELNLELLSHELIDLETKASQKRINIFDEAFTKLKRGNKESVDAMRVIEKTFVEEQKQEKQAFNDLLAKVKENDDSLNLGLDNYHKNYKVENETKKLVDSKEKAIQPKMMVSRKETHDANFKYDRILKEEKDTLREKQDNFEEFEKNSKAKIFDLEKRCRLELSKSKSQTVASYDLLQKQLLETNNRKEIKDINKKIQEMQKQGIKNEKNIKLNYQDLIEVEKLNYEENKKKLLIDITNTNLSFTLKKLEIEKEKKHINLRTQIELDKYDFGSKRAITNLNQKMVLKKNSLVLSYKEKKRDLVLKAKEDQIEKINYKETVTNDFVNVMENNYKASIENLKMQDQLINTAYVNELNKYDVFMKNVLENVCEMIKSMHSEYYDNVIKNEYDNVKLLINAKYNYETLNKKSYDEFIKKIETLYEEFKEKANNSLNKYLEDINKFLNDTYEFISNGIKKLQESLQNEQEVKSFHAKLAEVLNEEVNVTKSYEKDYYEKERNDFEYIDSQVKDYEDTKNELEKENEEENKVHNQKNQEIDDEVASYYEKQDLAAKDIDKEYEALVLKEQEEAKAKILEYENNCVVNTDTIKKEKVENTDQIEKDYLTAIKLLK